MYMQWINTKKLFEADLILIDRFTILTWISLKNFTYTNSTKQIVIPYNLITLEE